jgi:predicted O-methyltransferase YrrM
MRISLDLRSIVKKVKRFSRAVYFRLRAFYLHRVWNVVAIYYWKRMRRYPALVDVYRRYRRLSKSTGVNIWDCVILYEVVRREKPHHILEFGTGASTAYMALALSENYEENHDDGGVLLSIESDRFFLEHQKEIFPKELGRFVDFVYGPVRTMDFEGKKGFVHENVPRRPYDLIWVDGPALTDSIRFSADVVELLSSCSANVKVLFDGRDETAQFVYKMIGPNHYLRKYSHLHMNEIGINEQEG